MFKKYFFFKQTKEIYQLSNTIHTYNVFSTDIYYIPQIYFRASWFGTKNAIEIVQIMHAYGSAPFFHNNPIYDYWNVLNSPFSNPFRTMTRTILNSEVSEIILWIRNSNVGNIRSSNNFKRESVQSNALTLYENFIKYL